ARAGAGARARAEISGETCRHGRRTAALTPSPRAMNSLLGDLRYALRRARSRIGFTAIAILSLGLGIGVNTAAFSLVNAIVLRKTPLPQPERVAEIYETRDGQLAGPFSYPDYRDLRERSRGVFKQFSLSGFAAIPRDLGDHMETLTAELVNGDYFALIGM